MLHITLKQKCPPPCPGWWGLLRCLTVTSPDTPGATYIPTTTQLGLMDLTAPGLTDVMGWGQHTVCECLYEPVAFSDHKALVVSLSLTAPLSRLLSPRSHPIFKICPDVIHDEEFQQRLSLAMSDWEEVRNLGVEVSMWWESMVKPGIRHLAIERGEGDQQGEKRTT